MVYVETETLLNIQNEEIYQTIDFKDKEEANRKKTEGNKVNIGINNSMKSHSPLG